MMVGVALDGLTVVLRLHAQHNADRCLAT